jgi:hypothetical protein
MVNKIVRSEQRRLHVWDERTVLTTTYVEEVPRKIRFLRFRESAKAAKAVPCCFGLELSTTK